MTECARTCHCRSCPSSHHHDAQLCDSFSIILAVSLSLLLLFVCFCVALGEVCSMHAWHGVSTNVVVSHNGKNVPY